MIDTMSPNISILGIGTALPANRIEQGEVLDKLEEALHDSPNAVRWARRIFKQCGVATRYTCEPNLIAHGSRSRYLPSEGHDDIPSTAERMGIYKRESVPLALRAAQDALRDGEIEASQITHLITVSCTGQFLPGLDAVLVKEMGLSPRVQRIPLTFQGCAAGLKAIQLAKTLVEGQSSRQILIVCVELCTLHFQPSSEREALFGASFFGDGASACVIGAASKNVQGLFQLGDGHSVLMPDCSEEMIWEVGDYGFDLYLSTNIPKLLGHYLTPEMESLLDGEESPSLWAIHPGGRGIVDVVAQMFELSDEQVQYSRSILHDYGNLSSATILFVLKAMREDLRSRKVGSSSGVALAFGPGLTAELLKFTYLPSAILQEQAIDHVHS
ncbi:type III polyketide synthase [Paenibacillus macquariensis]|uniref:Predicted naringenin-chalcone synthase n=1 Tax=Paenibacillus macquariensis TaxID=948756 RepID=A0ABY1JZ70_9BACL|nr:type III polyketide synthase [Paenibacillus macquariensis]MEC0091235.1 type III polyketide synthase [Paenibacillus macquariensis]OAB37933.1 stilbene synthase [Paenibacillus macquariensis subsp. macquariensis]SIR02440.1 Predicted naringenin-chalcone synthase [Paenibacillus macquariensis]